MAQQDTDKGQLARQLRRAQMTQEERRERRKLLRTTTGIPSRKPNGQS